MMKVLNKLLFSALSVLAAVILAASLLVTDTDGLGPNETDYFVSSAADFTGTADAMGARTDMTAPVNDTSENEALPQTDDSTTGISQPVAAQAGNNSDHEPEPAASPKADIPARPTAPPIYSRSPMDKLTALREVNSDAIGWLTLDGTGIDFPILQTTDNDYYLYHDAYGRNTKDGAVFLDYQLSPGLLNANNLIYAHNLNAAGKGFSDLINYKNKTFFNAHSTGRIYTLGETYRFEIFSVYVHGGAVNSYTWFPASSDAFLQFVDEIKTDSLYYRDLDIQWGDRLLTFCTCSYEFENARTIVHAKIIMP